MKPTKIFFINLFLSIYENWLIINNLFLIFCIHAWKWLKSIIKKTKKCFEKKLRKDIKIFLKKKKEKDEKKTRGRYKNLPDKEKENKLKYHLD